jgi:hypothetical protein
VAFLASRTAKIPEAILKTESETETLLSPTVPEHAQSIFDTDKKKKSISKQEFD